MSPGRPLFSGLDLLAVWIDGIQLGSYHVICAVGVDAQGNKHVLGLREGATEHAVVVKVLLEDLVARGLDPKRRRLFVIDTPVQRCRNHTIRTQSQNGGPRSSFPLSAQPRVPGLVSEFV